MYKFYKRSIEDVDCRQIPHWLALQTICLSFCWMNLAVRKPDSWETTSMEKGTLSNWPKGAKAEAEAPSPLHKTALPFTTVLSHPPSCAMVRLFRPLLRIAKPIVDCTQPLTINARYRLCRSPAEQRAKQANDCCLAALSLRFVAVSTLEGYY
jgi:hypothetical protein